jgi:hypothetical protein
VSLAEIGDVSAVEMAAFAERRFGVVLNPRIIPLINASLRDRDCSTF